ncbi:MAG: helix-turn-helix domain-containing protein [Ilumatobacteraceae bacterium]
MDAGEIGQRIRELREQAGLRSKQFAEELGIDPSGVSNLESGKRAVKASELAAIARLLGVSPLAILEPESLLARLPVSARSDSSLLDAAIRQRLIALAEFHSVLNSSGISRPATYPTRPALKQNDWLSKAKFLAKWARQQVKFDASTDVFENLAGEITAKLGIDVLVDSEAESSVMGAAITDPEFPLLYVNSAQKRSRALFTLAHELGHVLAGDGSSLRVDGNLAGREPHERFANAFAAEFLMPEEEIQEILNELGKTQQALIAMLINHQVSFESLIYRLHNLRIINAEGRDHLRATGFSGLMAQVDNENELSSLMELNTELSEVKPPWLLVGRLVLGYKQGVISARPLAGLLGQSVEDVIELFSADEGDDSLNIEYFETGNDENNEFLFDGVPV